MQAKKLFVGNCSYDLEENTLKEFMEAQGLHVTSVQIVRDRFSQRSKGFGFVELAEDQDVNQAIEAVNGKELSGRALTVDLARERTPKPAGGHFDRGGRGGENRGERGHKGRRERW